MSIVSNMIVKFDINEFDAYPSPPNLVCETFILLPFHKLSWWKSLTFKHQMCISPMLLFKKLLLIMMLKR